MENETNSKDSRFLVVADAHVKSRTWVNYPQLAGDAYMALIKLAGMVPENVKDAIVAGDWFDSNRPSSGDVMRSRDFLNRFDNVWYIRGNHDSASPGWVESLMYKGDRYGNSAHLLDVDCNGPCLGASWCLGRKSMLEKLDQLSGKIKSFRDVHGDSQLFIVLHASFRHLLGFDGWQLEIADLESRGLGNEHFIVGDIHVPNLTVLSGGGWVLSPGALYPQSLDQVGHGFNACLVGPDYKVEWLHPEVREYVVARCESAEDVVKAHAGIKGNDALPLKTYIRVACDHDLGLTREQLDSIAEDSVLHVVKDGEEAAGDGGQAEAGTVASLEDAVSAELQDEDLRQMAGVLLSSDDPLAEIEKWLTFWKIPRI